MLNRFQILTRRLGLALGLVLSLMFVLPMVEAHACAPGADDVAFQLVMEDSGPADPACPDCGPACSAGCCHITHSAVMPDFRVPDTAPVSQSAARWSHATDAPTLSLDGPDRPPRL